MQQAFEFLGAGRLSAAEGIYREVLRTNPANASARNQLAVCLIRQRRHEEAVPVLESLLSTAGAHPDVADHLGLCHLEGGRLQEALQVLRACVSTNPRHGRAWKAAAEAARRLGRDAEAAEFEATCRELEGADSGGDDS